MNKIKDIILGKDKDGQIIRLLFFIPILFIILAFVYDTPLNLINGLWKIITTKDRLFTDYFALAGKGAAYLNSGLVTLAFAVLIKIVKPNLNGMALAAQYMVAGFAFLGIDVFNIWPIYIGTFLYSKFRKEEFKNYIYIAMLLADIVPFASELFFLENVSLWLSIPLGIVVGIVMAFVAVPLAQYTNSATRGYNLYNIGFASGLLGIVVASLYKLAGLDLTKHSIFYEESNVEQIIILSIISVLFLIYGILIKKDSIKEYKKIIKDSGRSPSDFVVKYGVGPTLINIGVVGIMTVLFLLITNSKVTGGLLYAGALSVLGFAAFGKQARSVGYIYLGALLCSILNVFDIQSGIVAMCILLGTALCPVGGQYGMLVGMISIVLHLALVTNLGQLHGNLVLYNNGFSAGLVAFIMVPIIDGIKGGLKRD